MALAGLRHPVEWEPLDGILLTSWTADLDDSYRPLTEALLDRGITLYVCSRQDEDANDNARSWLEDEVVWLDCGVDTVWVRDWGPFFIEDPDIGRVLVDSAYMANRPNDNHYPTDFGGDHFDAPVEHLPMRLDGGNVLPLEDGRCISSSTVHTRTPSYDADSAAVAIEEALGCEEVIWVEPIPEEPTGHADFHILPLPGGRVLSALPENDEVLEDAGLDVIPLALPGAGFATYQNAVWAEQVLLVPTYAEAPNEEALALIQDALPDVEVVGIPSDALIERGGAIHCVVKQVFTPPEIMPPVREPRVDPEPLHGCNSASPPRGGLAGWLAVLFAWISTWRGRARLRERRSPGPSSATYAAPACSDAG